MASFLNHLFSYGLLLVLLWGKGTVFAQQKPNVLFIAIDDLNDYVSLLQDYPGIQTPNLDKFAKQAMTFTNAHTAAPLCNPSRTAVLTGFGPNRTGIHSNKDKIQDSEIALAATFLPELFKAQGYLTLSAGKIFHSQPGDERMKSIWDEELGPKDYGPRPLTPSIPKSFKRHKNFDYQAWTGPDTDFPDVVNTEITIQRLKQTYEKPFFMAMGYYRPHNPWTAPKRYFDMYPLEEIQLPPVLDNDLDDLPAKGKKMAGDGLLFQQLKDSDHWRKTVQAYMACITFMDDQLGQLLDALAQSPHAENTIVVLFSDHGFHLGEKTHFAKHTIWERSARTLMMMKVPKLTQPNSQYSYPVSLLDLYPTLVDLCELEAPSQELFGHSLRYALADPTQPAKRYAITINTKGCSVRSKRWRYIDYGNGTGELYDLLNDPHEWANLWQKRTYSDIKRRLKTWVPSGAEIPNYEEAEFLETGTDG
ncbi:sulfatase [Pontibacter sp. G13]|uniref:sulfatase n=1 Tax=Pontibacter sp. G13 TaxID=3074898 RepID=UPI00288C1B24|nr:sulfatase [Pontibacter sp. G13]WNJ20647.1 sulfatase [Pontibacter sp. G13]